jgi:cholesterol transport system auxiliary component
MVTACSPLGGTRETYSLWGLDSPSAIGSTGPAVDWQLTVDLPIAVDPLSGSRIALVPDTGAWGVYRGARWSAPTTELVQALIVRALEDSGRIVGVARSGAGVRADRVLVTELRGFHVLRQADRDIAVIRISAKRVRQAGGEVEAARVFEAQVPVEGRGIAGVIAAFQAGLDDVLPALVTWTLQSV